MKTFFYFACSSLIAAAGIAVSNVPHVVPEHRPFVSQTAPIVSAAPAVVGDELVGRDVAGKPALAHAQGW